MLRLVIGGSASGKSEYAEELILSLSGDEKVDYIATMKYFDDEVEERILRHRKRREGSRFVTIEKEKNLQELDRSNLSRFAMLECMSNLLANEMFAEYTEAGEDEYTEADEIEYNTTVENSNTCEDKNCDASKGDYSDKSKGDVSCLVKKIINNLEELTSDYSEFVVVTNDIFEDSIVFDEVTKKYIRALGELNRILAEKAGSVTEVVCGIPLTIK